MWLIVLEEDYIRIYIGCHFYKKWNLQVKA